MFFKAGFGETPCLRADYNVLLHTVRGAVSCLAPSDNHDYVGEF